MDKEKIDNIIDNILMDINSEILTRHDITKKQIDKIWDGFKKVLDDIL